VTTEYTSAGHFQSAPSVISFASTHICFDDRLSSLGLGIDRKVKFGE